MKNNNINVNINNFAAELSELIGQYVGSESIHPSIEGRFYYIQAPKTGAPMLLHHYRGPLFVDIHPDDFESISSGKISAHDYITSANWQVGYYRGGGSMISGGYYQPLDIIGRNDEVRRYLQILSCRACHWVSGCMPSKKKCVDCFVKKCPFSKYKVGNWNAEISEYDPRIDLLKSLRVRFEEEHPGFAIRSFFCQEIPDGEIWISPMRYFNASKPFSFTAYVPDSLIRSLLMHEVEPENWNDYAKSFQFRIYTMFDRQTYDATKETLEKVYEKYDFTKKANMQLEEMNEEKVSLIARVKAFFKKMF